MRFGVVLTLGIMFAALLGGCSSPQAADARFEAGQYVVAFEAAKEALRDFDFSLERVDAAGGVITTRSKSTGGLGTPWDREQSTFGQEVEDLMDRQSRVARVT